MKEYLTIQETAAFLELPIDTIYKFARTSKLPASKVGRYWRFEKSKIEEWRLLNNLQIGNSLQIMVVDDEPIVRDLISTWLRSMGHTVDAVNGGEKALELGRIQQYDLVFLDLHMPHRTGPDVLRSFRKLGPQTEFVITTSYFESALMEEALALGILTVLKKPFTREGLIQTIAEHQRLKSKKIEGLSSRA